MLLKLPYFDPIRVHVIDPMHNLLLGTAKMVILVLLDLGILCQHKMTFLKQIQDTIEQIHAPQQEHEFVQLYLEFVLIFADIKFPLLVVTILGP